MRIVDLTIQDIAFGGKGVARDHGKAVFVPYTIDGEKVTAEIVREKRQFAEAELVEVRESSPHRVTPPCPYFGRCGGCAYQHIDYEHHVGIKWRQVRDILRRIGKIAEPPIRPIIPSPDCYGYRNRITVHVEDGVVGFFRRESNRLIDVESCPIAKDEVNQELHRLRESRPRDGHYTLRAGAGPRIFSQTNDAVAEALRQLVVGLVAPNQDLLIDAYCGAGFFAKALLDKFERIVGIDWDRFAVEEAKKTATAKETYIAGDVEEALVAAAHTPSPKDYGAGRAAMAAKQDTRVDEGGMDPWPLRSTAATTIVVDPPATGLTTRIRKAIAELAPETFIYISCNPATLARDLKDLTQRFDIESVTPLDMFPQTAEIETVAHLKRRDDRYIEDLGNEIAA
ncbi:MAG TPA: TRAM domain-containing protein [Chthoniobacterales bacterium]|nr:TRAM domain-containing protein [Chthoniobacterales bacterium]